MPKVTPPASGTGPQPGGSLLHGVDWAIKAGVAEEVMIGTRVRVRRSRRRRLAAAAGVSVVALACGLWYSAARHSAPMVASPATAVVDMPERQTLPDGSVVELKDDSRISVAFTPGFRRVVLESGEALFKVAKNKERPFVVVAGDVEVRAVGTAFSVQRADVSVEVLVTEGRVTVDKLPPALADANGTAPARAAAPQTIATLDAGHRAVVGMSDSSPSSPLLTVQAVSVDEVSQRLAWRIPRLEFTQTPLGEAIKMINEHSHERLSLEDNSLGNVRISGVLRADHIETLLRLLDAEHGIDAEHRPDGEIVLVRRR
jgi:transmembrane sensor